jgi:hypothetical protein
LYSSTGLFYLLKAGIPMFVKNTNINHVILDKEPFIDTGYKTGYRGNWEASWIDHPERIFNQPSVALFSLKFCVEKDAVIRIHVSADNRYKLFVDGEFAGKGSERSEKRHWRFESYDLKLAAGEHVISAQTWWLGIMAPHAQMSHRPAFIVAAEGEWGNVISTGLAHWTTKLVSAVSFIEPGLTWGTGAKVRVDGNAYPWGWETGKGDSWVVPVKIVIGRSASIIDSGHYGHHQGWLMTPGTLPAMKMDEKKIGECRYLTDVIQYPVDDSKNIKSEAVNWNLMLNAGGKITIPANTARVAVIDLGDYYCAYPQLTVSGGSGAVINIHWAEALFLKNDGYSEKGNRNEIEGKFFVGNGDEFIPDGNNNRTFTTLWWEAGRYVEICVKTGDAPITIDSLTFVETGYPLEVTSSFTCDDERVNGILPIAKRAMQMCMHETYMDCPYYEQMMYIGDTRLEVLVTDMLTADDRLPRKALQMFDYSREATGFTYSRYPTWETQTIPPFTLWWVCMMHDHWLWRGDLNFLRTLLPGMRSVMEAFNSLVIDDILTAPSGWNFTDWVPNWGGGIAPDSMYEPNGILNAQFVYTLLRKAELEDAYGDPRMAIRDRDIADKVMQATFKLLWNEEKGILADNLSHTSFSEHAQCLALLTGMVPADKKDRMVEGLLNNPDLARTTIYFSHYLFETLYQLDRMDVFFERLGLWFDLEKTGFKTTFEMPEPSRSDCHAWAAHPIYHFYASILGIRPIDGEFKKVRIMPRPGNLKLIEGNIPHPNGTIAVKLNVEEGLIRINLPVDVTGEFIWEGKTWELDSGLIEILL